MFTASVAVSIFFHAAPHPAVPLNYFLRVNSQVSGHNIFTALDGCCQITFPKGYINLCCRGLYMHVPCSEHFGLFFFFPSHLANYIGGEWLLNVALICMSDY